MLDDEFLLALRWTLHPMSCRVNGKN